MESDAEFGIVHLRCNRAKCLCAIYRTRTFHRRQVLPLLSRTFFRPVRVRANHDIAAPSTTQHQRGKSVAAVRGHLPADAGTSVTVYIDQRQTMGVGWNLKIHEGVVGTITLSGPPPARPIRQNLLLSMSRALLGSCASCREVSLFTIVTGSCAPAVAATDSNNADKTIFFISFPSIGQHFCRSGSEYVLRGLSTMFSKAESCSGVTPRCIHIAAGSRTSAHAALRRGPTPWRVHVPRRVSRSRSKRSAKRCSLRSRSIVGANRAYPAFGHQQVCLKFRQTHHGHVHSGFCYP